jgi:hypothetical protein
MFLPKWPSSGVQFVAFQDSEQQSPEIQQPVHLKMAI